MSPYWPLTGLSIRSGSVELRVPSAAECEALANAAAREPEAHPLIPFLGTATDTPDQRGRRTMQWLWRNLGTWEPDDWSFTLAAFDGGQLVGLQNVRATAFARTREVRTGVWIFSDKRGRGLGTQSRRALLHLIFDGLGAQRVQHRAASDNPASLAMARSLGYLEGSVRDTDRDRCIPTRHLWLTADRWRALTHPEPVHLTGLDDALFIFGLGRERHTPRISPQLDEPRGSRAGVH